MSDPEPAQKRRRVAPPARCLQCRKSKSKTKCDRSMPCGNCAKQTPPQDCSYGQAPDDTPGRANGDQANESRTSLDATRSGQAPDDTPVRANGEQANESRTSLDATRSAIAPVRTTVVRTDRVGTRPSALLDAFCVQYDEIREAPDTPAQSIPRLVSHKTRVFGQSHWITPCLQLYGKDLTGVLAKTIPPQALANLHRCKALARLIKARRPPDTPQWPTTPTLTLPTREEADCLIQCYFESTETLYPLLHGPTFRDLYHDIWEAVEDPPMDAYIQVKLVLAIGALTYADDFSDSLRSLAVEWIHEAMTWNANPYRFKARMTIRGLQNSILTILAQSLVGVGRDMVWPAAASLLRCAMQMGLHRDPSKLKPASDIRTTELRRRLWNTILEITTQASFDVGGAPLLTLDDFDTLPPSNLNDSDLLDSAVPRIPPPLTKFTEITVAAVLRQTLPARLAILQFLNGLPAPSPESIYATTLKLDADLRAAYASLSSILRPQSPSFPVLHIELLIQRYLAALHVPFLAAALIPSPDPSPFLYSRTSALSAALRIWSASTASSVPIFTRFVSNGASFLRASSLQAVFVVATELRTQVLAERASLVPTEVRPDLVKVLEEAEEWALECVRKGETNVKGYLFVAMVRAQLEALRKGVVGETEVAEVLGSTAVEAGGRCVEILEGVLSGLGGEEGEGRLEDVFNGEEEGEFEMSDLLFGFESAEAIDLEF